MSLSRKSLWLLLLTFVLTLVLAACSNDDEEAKDTESGDSDTSTTESGEATSGGDLIISEISDAQSLDPHMSTDVQSSKVNTHIYETLIKYDKNGEFAPGLAESWTQLDDTTWEFKIRTGVTFHDGEKLNAEVVKKNFDRIIDPKVGSPRFHLFEMLKEVKVIDETTVQFVLSHPFAPILSHLTHNGSGIISPKAIDADYAAIVDAEDDKEDVKAGSVIGTNPVGTGLFVFDSWTPGTDLKLVKNENYWGTPAHLDSVTIKVIPEPATTVAEIQAGNVHIGGRIQPTDVAIIEGSGVATVDKTKSTSLTYIGFNTTKEPFNNPLVRQAISKAIDRKALLDSIYEGYGIEANGPLAPDVFGYTEDIASHDYNIEDAKALLAEAGYADGFSTTIWTNDNQVRQNVAIVLQQGLKELGIDLKIEVIEWGAYLDKTAAGEHEMFILGWSTPTFDADYGLYALLHSSQHGVPGNRAFYTSEKMDELLDAARREKDVATREGLYKEVMQLVVEDAPFASVLYPDILTAVSNKVSGLYVTADDMFHLEDVKITE